MSELVYRCNCCEKTVIAAQFTIGYHHGLEFSVRCSVCGCEDLLSESTLYSGWNNNEKCAMNLKVSTEAKKQ